MNHLKWFSYVLAGLLAFVPSLPGDLAVAQANQKVFRKVTAEDLALAKRYLAEADDARLAGHYEEAISLYTKSIHLNERLGGYAGRGYCFLKTGNFAQARRDADTSIANRSARDLMRPGMNGLAEYIRAVSAYKLGDFVTAARDIHTVLATPYAKESDFQSIIGDVAIKAQLAKREALRKSVEKERVAAEDSYLSALKNKEIPPVYNVSSGFVWDRTAVTQEYLSAYENLFAGRPASELNNYVYAMIPEGGRKSVDYVLFVPRHIHMTGLDGSQWNEDNIVMLRVAQATITTAADGQYILHMLPKTPIVTRSYLDKDTMPQYDLWDYVDYKTDSSVWQWREEKNREQKRKPVHKVEKSANEYHLKRISDDASYFRLECFEGDDEEIGQTYKLLQLDNIAVPEYPNQ